MKSVVLFCAGIACITAVALARAEAPAAIDGAVSVSVDEARRLFDQGAVFIDVRDHQSWTDGHIDGAVNLNLETSEFTVLQISADLDRSTPLVFYSDSPLTLQGAIASYMAGEWGYRKVYYFRDGYYAWISEDFPAELRLAGRLGQGYEQYMVVTR